MNSNSPARLLIGKSATELSLLLPMANRHGLIAGATGTGKTITLQRLAEQFSAAGVPVFLADVKGDLSGLGAAGQPGGKIQARWEQLHLGTYVPGANPVVFWDLFGAAGHPMRATVSEMGPLLLSRLLQLNDVQSGVLSIIFRVADEQGLLLLDLKDLQAMTRHVGENASELSLRYGNIAPATIASIQRGLLGLEEQGAKQFFGEPALDLNDLLRTDTSGRGIIHLLSSERLMSSPKLYATLLLWLLSELFETLPEVGDLPKPKLVFFFDEAHLLFSDLPDVLLEKIEQVVRLIRSKGVGVYFVTQHPLDIPDRILGQLGNRFQHALRAFTPRDQKAARAAAETFRENPAIDTATAITELGVGEALVSVLDERGQPTPVERGLIVPPSSFVGRIDDALRAQLVRQSPVAGRYDTPLDRESAYERLQAAYAAKTSTAPPAAGGKAAASDGFGSGPTAALIAGAGGLMGMMAKSAVRTMGSSLGREIIRGVLGSIFGGRGKRR